MKKLRIASVILLVVGIIPLIASLLIPYIASIKGYSPSIGIIGGVDTDITKTLFWHLFLSNHLFTLVFCLGVIIAALFCIIFAKAITKNCNLKLSLTLIAASLTTAAGLTCFLTWVSCVAFDPISKSPIAYPLSIIGGIICLTVFVILIILYIKACKRNFNVKGLIIDIAAFLWFLPTFFSCCLQVCNYLNGLF